MAFNFDDDFDELDGDCPNSLEEEEIQTPFKDVNDINYPDKLCISKMFVCKANDALSNHERGKQREEHGSKQTNGRHTSLSRVPSFDDQVVQEMAQSRSLCASKNKAHSTKDKRGMEYQEDYGLHMFTSPNKSPSSPREVRTELTKLVIGTKHGRRRKAALQLVNFGGESPTGSLSDNDIVCNNKMIKEGMILEEAKKVLDFGNKLGIETKNQEEQILERFR